MWKCASTLSQSKVNIDCIYITMNSEIYVDKNEMVLKHRCACLHQDGQCNKKSLEQLCEKEIAILFGIRIT